MSEWWHRWLYPIRLLIPRNRRGAEEDLEAEVGAHLAIEAQENLEAGMSSSEARFAALRTFGNVGLFKEDARESWGVGPLDRFWQDLRYGARMLAKKRLVTAVAILSLGLGIGANAAVFTLLKAALYGAPPLYQDPNRLVTVWETAPRQPGERQWVSTPSYLRWKDEERLFETLAAVQTRVGVSLKLEDYPVQVTAQRASADLLPTLGVEPLLGRNFQPEEEREGGEAVVILGYGTWQSRFGGDQDIVGRSITIDRREHRVVGVMPRGFWFADGFTDLWIPLQLNRASSTLDDHRLRVVGKLEKTVHLREARARLDALIPNLEEVYASRDEGWGVRLELVRSIDALGGEVPPGFIQLFSALGLVLLVACTNIAAVMVARGSARQNETAVRAALGAGRFRLIRQLLTESVLLAGLGGAAGLLFTYWGVDLIAYFAPGDLSRSMAIEVDISVFVFALAVTVLTGLISGVAPALADSRVDVNRMLKEGGESHATGAPRQHLRSLLVVAEVAITLMLLVGVGLLIKSFVFLKGMDPGFEADRLMTFRIELPESETNPALLFDDILRRLSELPEVEKAASALELPPATGPERPFAASNSTWSDENESQPAAGYNVVSPGFFEVLGARLLRGRTLTDQDTRDSSWVMIVNQAMARRFWPGENPVGKTIRLEPADEERPRSIVGVVADLRNQGMSAHATPEMYVPLAQQPGTTAAERSWSRLESLFVLQVGSSSDNLGAAVRSAVAEVNPGLAIFDLMTMQDRLDIATQEILIAMFLNGPIILLALVLTAVGIYGVLSYSVNRRTREIGIRIALGADRAGLLKLVLAHGFKLVGAGVVVGVLGALALRRFLSSLLLGVVSLDLLLLVGAATLLTTVAMVASTVPARRATKVDPVTALRYE